MDEDAKKIRGSLIAVSVTIILYILAGGTLGTDGNFFGGTIHFHRVWILKLFFVIAFMYLLYRHILSTKTEYYNFLVELYYSLLRNKTYCSVITRNINSFQIKDHPNAKQQLMGTIQQLRNLLSSTYAQGRGTNIFLPPVPNTVLFPSAMKWNPHIKESLISYYNTKNRDGVIEVRLSDLDSITITLSIFRSFLILMINTEIFYSFAVPYLLASIASTLIILRLIIWMFTG